MLALNGNIIASNDDSNGCGGASAIVYTITTCGTYELREGCFIDLSCGGTTSVSSNDSVTFTGSTTASVTTDPSLSPVGGPATYYASPVVRSPTLSSPSMTYYSPATVTSPGPSSLGS